MFKDTYNLRSEFFIGTVNIQSYGRVKNKKYLELYSSYLVLGRNQLCEQISLILLESF